MGGGSCGQTTASGASPEQCVAGKLFLPNSEAEPKDVEHPKESEQSAYRAGNSPCHVLAKYEANYYEGDHNRKRISQDFRHLNCLPPDSVPRGPSQVTIGGMNESPKKHLKLLPLAVSAWIGGALGLYAGFLVKGTAAQSLGPLVSFAIGMTVAVAVGLLVGILVYRRLCE